MYWNQAREMKGRGHGVFSHTKSHRVLSWLSKAETTAEILDSLDEISKPLGVPQRVFAYPTGTLDDYHGECKSIFAGAGAKWHSGRSRGALGSIMGFSAYSGFPLGRVREIFLQYLTKIEQFKMLVRGA